MTTLTIQDESMTGAMLATVTFEIASEKITVRDLIRGRVFQEAKDANAKRALKPATEPFVQPWEIETVLNGSQNNTIDFVDWQCEFEKVIKAFSSYKILVFINDQQMTSLEEFVSIDVSTKVRFLRLNMLMGG